MASQAFTDGVTLSAASWAQDVDTAVYSSLSSVSGTNTITATGPVGLAAYASGHLFRFIPANTNTGATTLNITPSGSAALGAKNIFGSGVALLGGEIKAGVPVEVIYDGTQFNIVNVYVPSTKTFFRKNILINPSGRIYQRSVAATADDTYFADRWYMLTQTNTVTPSALSDPEDGFPVGVRITQSQAVAQRFGFAQIVEGRNCKHLRGQTGVMVPRVRISNSQAIRYAILGWTSTEDSVTSDVVNDWTSSTYTAGNFFLAANLSVLVVGAQTPSANTWTSLTPISAALGSSFNNLIAMVWTEGTAAQNVTLDWDYMQLEPGAAATEFEYFSQQDSMARCLYYTWVQGPASVGTAFGQGQCIGATDARILMRWPVRMRTAPTLTVSAAGDFDVSAANGATVAVTSLALNNASEETGIFAIGVAAGLAAGDATRLTSDSGNVATIILSAEL